MADSSKEKTRKSSSSRPTDPNAKPSRKALNALHVQKTLASTRPTLSLPQPYRGLTPIRTSTSLKRSHEFLVDMVFDNTLPRPFIGPVFIAGNTSNKDNAYANSTNNNKVDPTTNQIDALLTPLISYSNTSTLITNHVWKLHTERDLNLKYEPLRQEYYTQDVKDKLKRYTDTTGGVASKLPVLDEKDEEIVNWKGGSGDSAMEELKKNREVRARAENAFDDIQDQTTKTKQTIRNERESTEAVEKRKRENYNVTIKGGKRNVDISRVLNEGTQWWMKKTTYMSNAIGKKVHDYESLADTNKKRRKIVDEKSEVERMASGVESILNSFTYVDKPVESLKHSSGDTSLKAEWSIPFLPFVETWASTFILAEIPQPKMNNALLKKIPPPTRGQMGKCIITDVEKKSNTHRLECSVIVPPLTPNEDDDDDDDDISKEEETYTTIQQYDLEVVPMKSLNQSDINFALVIDLKNNGCWYHPLSSKVSLSTGRPGVMGGGNVSRVVKRRAMNGEELEAFKHERAKVDADLVEAEGWDAGDSDSEGEGGAVGVGDENGGGEAEGEAGMELEEAEVGSGGSGVM